MSDDARAQLKETNRETKERAKLYADVFETPKGKRVLEMLTRMFVKPSYVRGDTHETAHREGKRSVVSHIKRQIQISKDETPEEEE